MAENYDLIFGQSASQQYGWSDSDYQNGWQTVGSTPPTAEQFDALQRRSDTKAKDLNDRLSPLETKAEADGRQAATSYTSGAMLTVDGLPNGWLLECIAPGISGTDAITLPDTLIDGLTIIDGNVTWALRKVATNGGLGYRQPNTTYSAGQIAYHASLPAGWYLECTTAGTTGSGTLTITTPTVGGTVSDGTVTWTIRKSASTQDLTGYLPLSGGAMTGSVIKRNTNSNNLTLLGGTSFTKGADLTMFGESSPDSPSCFQLRAYSSADNSSLVGSPNGMLKWNGNSLDKSAVVAESLGANGYRKYASGLIEQWGREFSSDGNQTITLPIAFSNTSYTLLTTTGTSEPKNVCSSWNDKISNSQFKIQVAGTGGRYETDWRAIGY